MSLFTQLVDPKVWRVISTFNNNPQKEFHLQELSFKSKVPLASTFRIVHKLMKIRVLEVVAHNKMKMYRLNLASKEELEKMIGESK